MSNFQVDQVLAQIRAFAPTTLAPTRPAGAAGAGAASPTAFADLLRQGVDAVNNAQTKAATLADSYERGVDNVDLASVMIESQKASLSFRALTEVRNRLVNVYQDIMNMPI
jgi:flagellar hook-basal body complex protein FliE